MRWCSRGYDTPIAGEHGEARRKQAMGTDRARDHYIPLCFRATREQHFRRAPIRCPLSPHFYLGCCSVPVLLLCRPEPEVTPQFRQTFLGTGDTCHSIEDTFQLERVLSSPCLAVLVP